MDNTTIFTLTVMVLCYAVISALVQTVVRGRPL